MSGQPTYTKPSYSRRGFLALGLALIAGLGGWFFWNKKRKQPKPITGAILGAGAATGHKLRKGSFPAPSQSEEAEYVILGSGVSGLTAARELTRLGAKKIILLELESQFGGNAQGGTKVHSSFPWGAHYLPIPNNDYAELKEFLEEHEVITGYDAQGLPIYNEYYLCFEPEERLFIKGHWQECLIPQFGVSIEEKKETERFLAHMEMFRWAQGKDQKPAFAIPLDKSSSDPEYTRYDAITMQAFMKEHQYSSKALYWYVDYCCRDDYGTTIADTSAWAGIHYFAGRKAKAANADSSAVLTWPEGNFWLINKLKQSVPHIDMRLSALAYEVKTMEDGVQINYCDVQKHESRSIHAKRCIMAVPQFISQRLLPERKEINWKDFSYAPWMVANIHLSGLPKGRGAKLSWDNVFYDSPSLGYIFSGHQGLDTKEKEAYTFTYYLPLCTKDPAAARQEALDRTYEEWKEMVFHDLEKVHPGIRHFTISLDVWLWGHGMIRPVPGFIKGQSRQEAAKSMEGKIFFAHSDLSGISIFEEAFYQGIKAAKAAWQS